MPGVSLGENSKLTGAPQERERVNAFYRDILGCTLSKMSSVVDVFRLENFYLGVVYGDGHRAPPMP